MLTITPRISTTTSPIIIITPRSDPLMLVRPSTMLSKLTIIIVPASTRYHHLVRGSLEGDSTNPRFRYRAHACSGAPVAVAAKHEQSSRCARRLLPSCHRGKEKVRCNLTIIYINIVLRKLYRSRRNCQKYEE